MDFPDPLYIDNHLLVVCKPAGLLVQGDNTGDESLHGLAAQYLKSTFNKPGNVFLGIVHRLDRPVSGVIVLARTSKAAGRLSDQFRRKTVKKTYWALVEGQPGKGRTLTHWLGRKGATSHITNPGSGKKAVLSYRLVRQFEHTALLEVNLDTGRHHQIRLQLAHIGFPIIGDFRYGSKTTFPDRAVALHARSIAIEHPVSHDLMTFYAPLNRNWPPEVLGIESES